MTPGRDFLRHGRFAFKQRGELLVTDFDQLVPDSQARAELGGISVMTAWRYDRDEKMLKLGWPFPIKIGKRNFRSRKAIESFKAAVQEDAVRRRAAV
jgi:hypothetical protein